MADSLLSTGKFNGTTLAMALMHALEGLRADIIAASERAGQRATGRTYSRISISVTAEEEYVRGDIGAPEYFYTLIRGRGPGKAPADFGAIIMDWMRAKRLAPSDPKEFVRTANAIAWKIRREGSQLYRNHLYVDIADTPIKMFEEGPLAEILDAFMGVFISENLLPAGDWGHGYIM